MSNIREGFLEISQGWTLISGMDDITDRIERLGEWAKLNGPLLPDEEATIKLMIQTQIVRGFFGEDFEHSEEESE